MVKKSGISKFRTNIILPPSPSPRCSDNQRIQIIIDADAMKGGGGSRFAYIHGD